VGKGWPLAPHCGRSAPQKGPLGFAICMVAELLEKVAIIGVLVAISIPIFTSQLEKSREAVDEANLRSLYAEASAALLTDDTTATSDVSGGKLTVTTTNSVTTATMILNLTQQTDGLQNGTTEVNIGGVKVPSATWVAGKAVQVVLKNNGDAAAVSSVDKWA